MTKDFLKIAIQAARDAGDIIKKGARENFKIKSKGALGIVTEIDLKAEEIIIKKLEKETDFPILSEETRSTLPQNDTYWTVDPIDGTTNFSRGILLSPVSIALVTNNRPILGVTYNPNTDELFYAEQNKGAFLNKEKISVSKESKILVLNSGYEQIYKKALAKIYKKVPNTYSVRMLGATAYELALVACGKIDGFIGWGDQIWDNAAGVILIQEAGGIVTDWNENAWTTKTNYVLAGNKAMYPELLKLTSNI